MGKQYKIDRAEVKELVYQSKGVGENPYNKGSRKYRLWNSITYHYWSMESRIQELEQVYGSFGKEKFDAN